MVTRRVFLKSSGMAMVTLGFAPTFVARAAAAASSRRKLLITIFQRGAVDGLNMIVPFGDAAYYQSRPTIAIAKPGATGGAIDLNGFFGLHPRMSALKPLWENRSLAIVHACGSPDATRSHFDAQDYMESATPGVKSTRDGWLNRYLQVARTAHDPLNAVAMTRQMPRSLQGTAPALAMGSVGEFGVRGGMDTRDSFEQAYAAAQDQVLKGTAGDAFDAMRTLSPAGAGQYRPANGAQYPRSPFGQALQEIARLAKADVGLEIAFAESNQWDHHVNEGGATGQIANRLDDFAAWHRRARQGPRRPHGRHRHPDDVGVRTCGGGERQPRHRSRPRQRHDADRRRREGRRGLRPVARARASTSASRAATSRSRPTSAMSSAKSSCVTSARTRPPPPGSFRATASSQRQFRGILRGVTLVDLRTPAVLIERSRVIANIERMQAAARRTGIRLRPHAKTHKSPLVARWQIERGAIGICCAKIGEAEVFADAGIEDIRIPYPLNPVNAARVLCLLDRTHLSFIVDHSAHRAGLVRGDGARRTHRERARQSRRRLSPLRHRSHAPRRGRVHPPRLATCPASRCAGILAHAGHGYHAASEKDLQSVAVEEVRLLTTIAEACRRDGVPLEEISAGATPTARYSLEAGGADRISGRATTCSSIARRSASARRRSTTAR